MSEFMLGAVCGVITLGAIHLILDLLHGGGCP